MSGSDDSLIDEYAPWAIGLVVVGLGGVAGWRWLEPRLESLAAEQAEPGEAPADAVDGLATLAGSVWGSVWPYLALAAAAVLTGLVLRWWLARRARLRTEQAELVAAELVRVMPGDWDPQTQLIVRKWRGMSPRVLRVDLTASSPDHDQDWRRSVVKAARSRLGEVEATWPATAKKSRRPHRRSLLLSVIPPTTTPAGSGQPPAETEEVEKFLAGLVPDARARWVDSQTLTVDYGETTRDQSPQWRGRVLDQVQARTGLPLRASWDRQERRIVFRSVPDLTRTLPWHDVIDGIEVDGTVLPYGIDETGAVVAWIMGDAAPHGLVAGETGSGKTAGPMKSLVKSALRAGLLVGILDPKARDFAEFVGKPGVLFVATSIEDRVAALVDMHAEMMRRTAAAAARELATQYPELQGDLPPQSVIDQVPILLVIDEMTQHTADLQRWWAGLTKEERQEWGSTASKPPMAEYPQQFVQLARAIKMHMLFGVQRADGPNFGVDSTQLRDNVGFRTTMARTTSIGSKMVWGDMHTGSTVVIQSVGEGVTNGVSVDDEGRTTSSSPRRFKSFYTGTTPASWWDEVAAVAPDSSLIPLPSMSVGSRDPEAACRALLGRAYPDLPARSCEAPRDSLTAVPADPAAEEAKAIPPVSPTPAARSAAPSSAPAPLRLVANSGDNSVALPETLLEDEASATDLEGRTWVTVAVTALEVGDVVTFGDVDAGEVVEVEGWVPDEITDEDVFRVTILDAGEATVMDLGDEPVHKLDAAMA